MRYFRGVAFLTRWSFKYLFEYCFNASYSSRARFFFCDPEFPELVRVFDVWTTAEFEREKFCLATFPWFPYGVDTYRVSVLCIKDSDRTTSARFIVAYFFASDGKSFGNDVVYYFLHFYFLFISHFFCMRKIKT